MGRTAIPVIDRLMNRISVSGNDCWEWTGSLNGAGYGTLNIKEKTKMAHRISYEIHCGPIPEGMQVCHTCDNRRCINPKHFFLGTPKTNAEDREAKGRGGPRNGVGEDSGSAKITDAQVRLIRSITGMTYKDIGIRFGISKAHVHRIKAGKRRQTAA